MADTADVVDLIMQDHREVERLFEELRTSPDKRPNLVPVLTALLTAHSRAEEAEFLHPNFPAIWSARTGGEGRGLGRSEGSHQ